MEMPVEKGAKNMSLFEPVTREKAKLRLALTGVSGAGKTLSALYIAFGITGDWGKVALIDTEHGRGKFYANRSDLGTGTFLYAPFLPPYSPARYKNLVQDGANAVGADGVVIIDSFSHAWNNEGGVLDIKDQIASKASKNSYTAWSEAGKEQNSLVNNILSADCHTIVTMRSKMAYELQENDRGKKEPVKVGLAPVQREDTEYEFDIVLDISRNHIATASKDTTFLDRFGAVITPELGEQLKAWLDDGAELTKCDVCGEIIKPTPTKSVTEVIAGTNQNMGKTACMKCYAEWSRAKKNGVKPDDNPV